MCFRSALQQRSMLHLFEFIFNFWVRGRFHRSLSWPPVPSYKCPLKNFEDTKALVSVPYKKGWQEDVSLCRRQYLRHHGCPRRHRCLSHYRFLRRAQCLPTPLRLPLPPPRPTPPQLSLSSRLSPLPTLPSLSHFRFLSRHGYLRRNGCLRRAQRMAPAQGFHCHHRRHGCLRCQRCQASMAASSAGKVIFAATAASVARNACLRPRGFLCHHRCLCLHGCLRRQHFL